MRKFGLVGYPLGHSFSKKYFTEKFIRENISDCRYENYPLTDIDLLSELISNNSDIYGLNVTIPYKSAVIKYLDFIDDQARSVGAVNVLKLNRSGNKVVLKGFNSDIDGFRNSILPYLGDKVSNALVLGTGGGAKAVCYVLGKLGIKITSVDILKLEGVLKYSEVTEDILISNQLIVNTTPLGMFPDIHGKPDLNYSCLNYSHILFDLVYNPELTSFLKAGEEQGCTIISGINMLYGQAERAWEIWNDERL
ncbi:MAG TPA: shikimate dehydrogenase [Bacteroidales bacterium]